jgi:hypothetical protein
LLLNRVVFYGEDGRGWRIEGPREEGIDGRAAVGAGDGGGREERSGKFRVVDPFALSDAVSEFEP